MVSFFNPKPSQNSCYCVWALSIITETWCFEIQRFFFCITHLARLVWHDVQQTSDENIKALSVAVEFDIMKAVLSLGEDIYANRWLFPSYDMTAVIFKQTSFQWIGLCSVFGCCRAWWYPLLVLPILHHCCPSQMDLLPYQEVALLPSGTISLASVALILSPLIILDPLSKLMTDHWWLPVLLILGKSGIPF